MRRAIAPLLGIAALVVLGLEQPAQAQSWGNVKGKIISDGKVPKQEPIATIKDHADAKVCLMHGPVLHEKWVVNPKNKGLRWTFVWLANQNVKDPAPLPIHPNLQAPKSNKVEIDQPLCAFVPHALVMREGQILVAKNSAAVAHNLMWTGLNNGGNILIAAGGSLDVKNLTPERLPLKIVCSIHPWMNGWVGVFNHPYSAVTDADGAFEFKDAPAGKYSLMVWHGTSGYLGGAEGRKGRPITIKAGATLDVGALDFPPPKD